MDVINNAFIYLTAEDVSDDSMLPSSTETDECHETIQELKSQSTFPLPIASMYNTVNVPIHCKNEIVQITNLWVSTVTRNSGNYNLMGRVGCYDFMMTYMYNVIIIQFHLTLYCLLDIRRSRITF